VTGAGTTASVPPSLDGARLDAAVRALFDLPWSRARAWIARGKIHVGGAVVTDPAVCVAAGDELAVDLAAPRPGGLDRERVLFEDRYVVVVDKPAGVQTVPYADSKEDALIDAVRRLVSGGAGGGGGGARRGARPQVFVVHRLDRGTSGPLVFARTRAAAERLREQFRAHLVERCYVAIAHGPVASGTLTSHLLADRGDGLRGSREKGRDLGMRRAREKAQGGKLAVTHVEAVAIAASRAASLVACRLETGRTNQIRIHLAEVGHPLVGEKVYLRGYRGEVLAAPRLMLHAATLGFAHPASARPMRFEVEPPADFLETAQRLGLPQRAIIGECRVRPPASPSPSKASKATVSRRFRGG
jgi:23S rRNA pseudouridine1911/1915/1917 synthase